MPPSPTTAPGSPPLFQHHSPAPHSLNTPPHPPPASHSPSGSHHHPISASASASGSPRPRAAFQPPSSSSRQTRDRDEEARRSLQARGKNYNTTPGTWSRGGRGEAAAVGGSIGEGGGGWTWEARQRRDEAARILESEELLMWFAGVRCESIPQTRAHYRNVLLGLEGSASVRGNVVWREEWEGLEMVGQHQQQQQGMSMGSPGRGKGKERERRVRG